MFTITTQTSTGELQRFSYDTYKAAHIAARGLTRTASASTRITLRSYDNLLTVSY